MKTNENLTLFRVEAGVLCAGRRETTVGNVANLDLNSGMVSCDGDHDDDGHISGIFPLNMRSIKTKNASKRKSHTFLVFFP